VETDVGGDPRGTNIGSVDGATGSASSANSARSCLG